MPGRQNRPNRSGGTRNEHVDRPARARFSNWTPPWLKGKRGGRRGGGGDDSKNSKNSKKRQMYGPKTPKRVQAPSYLLDPAIAAARSARASERRSAKLHQNKILEIHQNTKKKQALEKLPWNPENLIDVTMSESNQRMVVDLLCELQANFNEGSDYFLEGVSEDIIPMTDAAAANSDLGLDEENERITSTWSCTICTFLNTDMSHLACKMCLSPRYDNSNVTNSNRKSVRKSNSAETHEVQSKSGKPIPKIGKEKVYIRPKINDLEIGSIVHAPWKLGGSAYRGSIIALQSDEHFCVQFDDGDKRDHIHYSEIFVKNNENLPTSIRKAPALGEPSSTRTTTSEELMLADVEADDENGRREVVGKNLEGNEYDEDNEPPVVVYFF